MIPMTAPLGATSPPPTSRPLKYNLQQPKTNTIQLTDWTGPAQLTTLFTLLNWHDIKPGAFVKWVSHSQWHWQVNLFKCNPSICSAFGLSRSVYPCQIVQQNLLFWMHRRRVTNRELWNEEEQDLKTEYFWPTIEVMYMWGGLESQQRWRLSWDGRRAIVKQ